jgi:hypothetical protein
MREQAEALLALVARFRLDAQKAQAQAQAEPAVVAPRRPPRRARTPSQQMAYVDSAWRDL